MRNQRSVPSRLVVVATLLGVLAVGRGFGDDRVTRAVLATAAEYLDGILNHRLDGDWASRYAPRLVHPDANPFALPSTYKIVAAEKLPKEQGLHVTIDSHIEACFESMEVVDFMKEAKPEDAFFVKVHYTVIAKTVDDQLMVLDAPADAYEYFVFAMDANDQVYKVIDRYPEPRAFFYGVRYFLQKYDQITGSYRAEPMDSFKKKVQARYGLK